MNIKALRQRPQWLILGTVILAAGVGGAMRIFWTPAHQADQPAPETTETAIPAEETVTLFESPMISLSAELRKAATPSELVASTATEDRLSALTTGRVDPFAPITRTIGATSAPRSQAVPTNAPAAATPPTVPPTPIATAPTLPPVPQVNFAPPLPAPPSIPIAPAPVPIPSLPSGPAVQPLPQDPVSALQLTGVVQVGDRVGVIVREGNGQSSRHVFEGDLLAGGQIRLKAIDMSANEPLVILEYQGKEFPRVVG